MPITVFLPLPSPQTLYDTAGGHFINGTFHQVVNFCVSPAFRHHLYIIQGPRSHFPYLFYIFNFKIPEKIHFEKVGNLMKCPICKGLMKCPLDEMSPHRPNTLLPIPFLFQIGQIQTDWHCGRIVHLSRQILCRQQGIQMSS
jgi:hypothetical protein